MSTCFISYSYPPCTTPLNKLEPIPLTDLRLETHHLGKVLIVRTFGSPFRIQSVQNAVEDEMKDVDQVSLYTGDPRADPAHVLPKNTLFAIKEPFYKAGADGGYIIRIDHPSDLVQLDPRHEMIPDTLRSMSSELSRVPAAWKTEGNVAYKKLDYLAAIHAYTRGLQCCKYKESGAVKQDLHRNRAIANLQLGRHEVAAADALAALNMDDVDEKNGQNNGKSHFRAGRAFYHLGHFRVASLNFRAALKASPNDPECLRELDKTKLRLGEEATGNYDFDAMSASASPTQTCLDHASYTANVVVKNSEKKGRGLFAAKDIKAGDLILCEKAFAKATASGSTAGTSLILNLNTNKGFSTAHAVLFYDLVQKMLHNPKQAKRFLDFFDGGYTPKCKGDVVDGITALDTFQVAAIMQHNCFGCPVVSSLDDKVQEHMPEDGPSQGAAVWILASYANHACDGNARRSFIGDMILVRATKEISQGEEVLMLYRHLDVSNIAEFQAELQNTWGFQCSCTICKAELATPDWARQQRQALLAEVEAFLKANPQSPHSHPSQSAIDKCKALYLSIWDTYGLILFHNVPRLGLIGLGAWLVWAFSTLRQQNTTIWAANALLLNLGYGVDLSNGELHIDRTHCYLEGSEIDAAVYAAMACYDEDNGIMGDQYVEFAKERCRTTNGQLRGFGERYGCTM